MVPGGVWCAGGVKRAGSWLQDGDIIVCTGRVVLDCAWSHGEGCMCERGVVGKYVLGRVEGATNRFVGKGKGRTRQISYFLGGLTAVP